MTTRAATIVMLLVLLLMPAGCTAGIPAYMPCGIPPVPIYLPQGSKVRAPGGVEYKLDTDAVILSQGAWDWIMGIVRAALNSHSEDL